MIVRGRGPPPIINRKNESIYNKNKNGTSEKMTVVITAVIALKVTYIVVIIITVITIRINVIIPITIVVTFRDWC